MFKKKSVIALVAVLMVPSFVASAEEAYRSNQDVLVNSQEVEIAAYNIEGYNYFRIRDIAKVLDDTPAEFAISYDPESKTVLVDRNSDYDPEEAVHIELEEFVDGELSDHKLSVDGENVDVKSYNVNDQNYFKLRDLGQVIGFDVDYNSENREIYINSNNEEGYDLVVEAASADLGQEPAQAQEDAEEGVEAVEEPGEAEEAVEEPAVVEEADQPAEEAAEQVAKLAPVEEVVEEPVEEGPSPYEQQVENFVQAALNRLGTPYSQIDCSTLVKVAMLDSGIDPGARWVSTRNIPTLPSLYPIPMSELRRGDVLNTRYPQAHAMIYIGDGKVVESQPRGGVVIRNVRTKNYSAFRLVDQTS